MWVVFCPVSLYIEWRRWRSFSFFVRPGYRHILWTGLKTTLRIAKYKVNYFWSQIPSGIFVKRYTSLKKWFIAWTYSANWSVCFPLKHISRTFFIFPCHVWCRKSNLLAGMPGMPGMPRSASLHNYCDRGQAHWSPVMHTATKDGLGGCITN